MSCIDGVRSESDLAAATGQDGERLRASLAKLEAQGLIAYDDPESAPRTGTSDARSAGAGAYPRPNTRSSIPSIAPVAPVHMPAPDATSPPSAAESDAAALAEEVELEPELRKQILALQRGLERVDHYSLLGVERTADKKVIKRAYYDLAAKLHPDRHFRKKLGSFKFRMESVFSRLTFAHDTLANPQKRAEYNVYLEEHDRLRGIEEVLEGAAAEVRRAEDIIERQARAQEQSLAAPAPEPQRPRPAPPITPRTHVDAATRREAFAKRLVGIRPSSPPSMPAAVKISVPPAPMTTTDAMDALRRRYEERVSRAKAAEARKYMTKAEEALAAGKLVEAASSFRVASGLAPTDETLKRKSADVQVKADAILSETYARQASYEERHGQWPEAARSWLRTCQLRPNDAHAHDHAAAAIVKSGGDMHKAVHLAKRACELEPERPAMRVTLGNAYLAAGLTLNAKREFEVAAKLAPDDGTIKSLLKRVDHGEGKKDG
jgi:curved DNA-binding protein CbpA